VLSLLFCRSPPLLDRHSGLLERNRQRIEALSEAGEKKPERGVKKMPGTVLTRECQGIEHRVTVTGTVRLRGAAVPEPPSERPNRPIGWSLMISFMASACVCDHGGVDGSRAGERKGKKREARSAVKKVG
jgi:hypothetical protein